MEKKLFNLITISLIALGLVFGPLPEANANVVVTAPSVVLLDGQTGRVLFSKAPHIKRAPASTTKILTAMTVIDNADLKGVIAVPKSVESVQPSKIYLKGGEKYSIHDLLKAVLIKSANDAAEALAIRIGGSRAGFSKLMNQKAREIGAKNSNFKTPNGLPAKGQYSTAYDLALIMREAHKYPEIVKILNIRSVYIESFSGRSILLKSNNKMLWRSDDVIGKTGWTRKARYCFVGRIQARSKSIYMGMLGSNSLWKDVGRLAKFPQSKINSRIHSNKKLWTASQTKDIQRALLNAGFYPGPIDGIFGSKTVAAIEKYQSSRGLKVDGICGPNTWKKLKSSL